MPPTDGNITHVSDTALMVAACRAMETVRTDGFVRDPFAERLAGERGMAIAKALPRLHIMSFGVSARTHFLDELVTKTIKEHGIRAVLSVACGLDARPWRLDLPAELRWIEVDFEDILNYKAEVLAGDSPKCRVERIATDLNDPAQRAAMFAAVPETPSLMITEGLLPYLPEPTVRGIASEAASNSGVRYWLSDVASTAFANAIQMDSFQQVQNMRAADHLEGDKLFEVIKENGWTGLARRSYLTDIWVFGGERLQQMMRNRPQTSNAPQLSLDDPTGVHLFARA